MKKYNKGFTLIELLVVIAIIGILAAVILASLNTSRKLTSNAAIKSNLANARAQAELYYTSNNNYAGTAFALGDCPTTVAATPAGNLFDDDAQIVAQMNGAATNSFAGQTPQCAGDSGSWAATAALRIPENGKDAAGATVAFDAWCVDSNGASKGEVTDFAGLGALTDAIVVTGTNAACK